MVKNAFECSSRRRNALANLGMGASSEFPNERLNKQPVAPIAVAADVAWWTRKQAFNWRKLAVPLSKALHRKAF
jgi:hypothetical protein